MEYEDVKMQWEECEDGLPGWSGGWSERMECKDRMKV
jgi:hypothetical protein